MNFRVLEKSICVLEKSWKFVSEKGFGHYDTEKGFDEGCQK